jgi:hypothetical protein
VAGGERLAPAKGEAERYQGERVRAGERRERELGFRKVNPEIPKCPNTTRIPAYNITPKKSV